MNKQRIILKWPKKTVWVEKMSLKSIKANVKPMSDKTNKANGEVTMRNESSSMEIRLSEMHQSRQKLKERLQK
jgi:hypothetical protein